jgi:hypothetical protein
MKRRQSNETRLAFLSRVLGVDKPLPELRRRNALSGSGYQSLAHGATVGRARAERIAAVADCSWTDLVDG